MSIAELQAKIMADACSKEQNTCFHILWNVLRHVKWCPRCQCHSFMGHLGHLGIAAACNVAKNTKNGPKQPKKADFWTSKQMYLPKQNDKATLQPRSWGQSELPLML